MKKKPKVSEHMLGTVVGAIDLVKLIAKGQLVIGEGDALDAAAQLACGLRYVCRHYELPGSEETSKNCEKVIAVADEKERIERER